MKVKNPFEVAGLGVTTPKGKALWCKNVTPDTTFNKEGELSTNLVLDPNDQGVIDFLAPLENMCAEAFKQSKENLGIKGKELKMRPVAQPDTDKDGNDTGMIKIKLKLGNIEGRKAEGKPFTINVVDAKKNKIVNPPVIGNGSTIRCSGFAFPYYVASAKEVGVSILWNAVQILELVHGSGGDDFGEEEGYTVGSESETSFDSVPF